MTINESNGYILNTGDIYIHDDMLLSLQFNKNEKTILLYLKKFADEKSEYTIKFNNVIGFDMTSCDFWGASERIDWFSYLDKQERVLIPRLQKQWQDVPHVTSIPSYDDYIEIDLSFISGDKLRIACTTIEIGLDTLEV